MTDTRERAGSVRTLIAVMMCGTLIGPLNSTMVAVALPQMATGLDIDIGTMSWLVTAYLIAMASLQPVAGKLGDRLGRRPMMLGGYALFGAVSAVAAFVPNLTVLIACRVVQAAAGALLMPTGMALLRESVPRDRLGRVFGYFGAIMPLAAAVGPVVGGALVQLAGWPAIFLVNLPITAFTFVFGWYVIPRDAHRQRATRFDVAGAIWLCAPLVVGTLLLGHTPGGVVLAGACVVLAAALVGFVSYELRHRDPVLQPRLFARRVFVVAAGGIALSTSHAIARSVLSRSRTGPDRSLAATAPRPDPARPHRCR